MMVRMCVYVYMVCYGVIVEQVLSWTKRGVMLCLVCAAYGSEEQTHPPIKIHISRYQQPYKGISVSAQKVTSWYFLWIYCHQLLTPPRSLLSSSEGIQGPYL